MYTVLYLWAGVAPYLAIVETWEECREWTQLHSKRGIQWAIRRNSDNVIIAQSKGWR